MTQLLSLFSFIFDKRSKSKNVKKPTTANVLQTVKIIKDSALNLYDAWIEARLERANFYNKHRHISSY
jgi:hypothetical protein